MALEASPPTGHHLTGGHHATDRLWRLLGVTAAVILLNASVTFENVWPTPSIRLGRTVSIELCVVMLAMMRTRPAARASWRAIPWLSAVWVALILGRYAQVTAPALYGREINLFWDLRYVPDVVAMVTNVAPLWLVVACITAIVLTLIALYGLVHWAFTRLNRARQSLTARWVIAFAAALAAVIYVADQGGVRLSDKSVFASPAIAVYARQAALAATAVTRSHAVPDSPTIASDMSGLHGADVLLVFIEAYGAVSFDRPVFAERLDPSRRALETAIRETDREVVSGFVGSPTFGGSSWLAHISLLTGIEVRDADLNARLMAEHRPTLVTAFKRHGYRAIAWMPGLQHQLWPEGAFYEYDEIYGAKRLAYRGPPFGWFAIPDQFSLARLDALEMRRQDRAPLFVVFPTISTHFPFSPTPPYQPDWPRMATSSPYDEPELMDAYSHQPEWPDFAPGYIQALAYEYATLTGYLRIRRERDFVMILIGDHQPAAAVSGEGATWEVPVHVIAKPGDLLHRLSAHGLRAGLTPTRPSLGPMHTLLPILLDAFGEPE